MTQSLARYEIETRATSKKREENARSSRATLTAPIGSKKNYTSWINDKNSEDKSSLDVIVDWLKEKDNYVEYMTEFYTQQDQGAGSFKFDDVIELLVNTGHRRRQCNRVHQQIKCLHKKYQMIINEFQEIATFDFDQDSQITAYNKKGEPYKLGDMIIKKFKYFYILRPVFLKWKSADLVPNLTEPQNNESSSTKDLGNKRPRENDDRQSLSKKLPRVIAESNEEKDNDDDDDDDDDEEESDEEEYKENNGGFWNWPCFNHKKDSGGNGSSIFITLPNTIQKEDDHQDKKSNSLEKCIDLTSEEGGDNKKGRNDEIKNQNENEKPKQKMDLTTTKDSNNEKNENKLKKQIETRNEEQQHNTNQSHKITAGNVKPYFSKPIVSINKAIDRNKSCTWKIHNRGNYEHNHIKDNHDNSHNNSSDNISNNNNNNDHNSRKGKGKGKPKKKTKKKKFSTASVIKQKAKISTRKLALNERKMALAERIVALEEKRFELTKKSLDLKEKGILLSEEVSEQKEKTKSLFGSLFKWLF